MSMRWIRLWVEPTLTGTTFTELSMEERGLWFSLLVLAAQGREPGIVQKRQGVGFRIETLADLLECDVEALRRGLLKLQEVGKITLDDKGRIVIANWHRYQTQYARYRKGRHESMAKPTEQSNVQGNVQEPVHCVVHGVVHPNVEKPCTSDCTDIHGLEIEEEEEIKLLREASVPKLVKVAPAQKRREAPPLSLSKTPSETPEARSGDAPSGDLASLAGEIAKKARRLRRSGRLEWDRDAIHDALVAGVPAAELEAALTSAESAGVPVKTVCLSLIRRLHEAKPPARRERKARKGKRYDTEQA